jgi:hypothetical protein
VIGYEDIERGGSCEDMEQFIGLGLNQGSKQWGILSCFSKCARRRNETQEAGECIFLEEMADIRH